MVRDDWVCARNSVTYDQTKWSWDHITAALMALHWLPVRQRITSMYPETRSRVWAWTTVLDEHDGVCVTTYRQVSSTFSSKRGIQYITHSHYLRVKILFLSQLHRLAITCRLTFDVSPPSPPSRDISRPICLWLHIPVRLNRSSFHLRITVFGFTLICVYILKTAV